MEDKVLENQQKYQQRLELYRSFGYDIEKERDFIIDKVEPIYGDLLDVGTGKGHFAIALAKRGYSLTSVDVSEQEQEIARLNVKYLGLEKKIDFRLENAQALSFKDGSFDVILSVNMIHHLTNPFEVINELVRVISFEGKLILSDFTKEGLELIEKVHASGGRKHGFTKANLGDIDKYLLGKGFRTEMIRDKFQEILIAYHPLM